ncbi:hypothetical protein ACI2KS_07840 [Pseudomonas sp. NPDC087358]|uniref:hypothetical protein n=1 Tax=Pseudomonas sp. NPDC087358 TaxID=3364439 RepID=UPI00384EE105
MSAICGRQMPVAVRLAGGDVLNIAAPASQVAQGPEKTKRINTVCRAFRHFLNLIPNLLSVPSKKMADTGGIDVPGIRRVDQKALNQPFESGDVAIVA